MTPANQKPRPITMTDALYTSSPIKRERRTRAAMDAIRDALLRIVLAGDGMTVRHLFYRLVAVGAVEKTEPEYDGTGGAAVMSNRTHRRAEAARARRADNPSRAELVTLAMRYLADRAGPTATGATLMRPDGTTTYISAADARALYGSGKPEGTA